MVLYVFVAAYVGAVEEPIWEPIPGQRFLAPLLVVALFVELSIAILGTGLTALDSQGPQVHSGFGTPSEIGNLLLRALPGGLRNGLDAAAGGRGGRGRARRPSERQPEGPEIDGRHLVHRPVGAPVRDRRRRRPDPA